MAIDATWTWRLLAVAVLVLLNGFFVAAEFAIVKVRRTQLSPLLADGTSARARTAARIVDDLDAYLSACQLGITLASLALGWVGEPFVASLIEAPLVAAGITSQAVLHGISFAVAFGLITFLHITVGEQAPKMLAIQRALRVTLWIAQPLRVFYIVFKPFIWVLNRSSNLMLRGVGLRETTESESAQSEEELRLMLAEAGAKRTLRKDRAELLLRAFRLTDLDARQVMTPRTVVVALDLERPLAENVARAKESGYSRFPIIEGSLDRVTGMVHIRDLHELADKPRELRDIIRPVRFVPETTSLDEVMRGLLRRSMHMAIVIDEHSSTAGILTLEDIFEEIFGEIRDEFDAAEAESPVRSIGEGRYVVEGQTPLHQAAAALGVELEAGDVTTIGGYVVAQLGRVPAKGERVRLGPYEATVREGDRKRIQLLELWRADAE